MFLLREDRSFPDRDFRAARKDGLFNPYFFALSRFFSPEEALPEGREVGAAPAEAVQDPAEPLSCNHDSCRASAACSHICTRLNGEEGHTIAKNVDGKVDRTIRQERVSCDKGLKEPEGGLLPRGSTRNNPATTNQGDGHEEPRVPKTRQERG